MNFQKHTNHDNKPKNASGSKPLFFQPKLSVNKPGDSYEQEADAMADKVMRMTDGPLSQSNFFKPASSVIQRKCKACEEDDKKIHRKDSDGSESQSNSTLDSYVESLSSAGQPLPETSRQFFEPRFSHDFSNVRIHNDTVAAKSARSINALAYTTGNNIVFNSGQYAPESEGGKRLLAHELTHVVQQQSGVSPKLIQRTLVVDPAATIPLAPGTAGPPTPLTSAVQGLIDQTCPDGHFQVNPTTGVVSVTPSFCTWHPPLLSGVTEADNSSTPVGCNCLCNEVNQARRTTISFRAGGPFERPDSLRDSTSGTGSNTTVNIDPNFHGQYLINGRWVDLPFFLLFSHELCGHALESMRGTHAPPGARPPGGTPADERHAVDVERDIAREHSLPIRPDDYSGAARQRP